MDNLFTSVEERATYLDIRLNDFTEQLYPIAEESLFAAEPIIITVVAITELIGLGYWRLRKDK